MVLFPRQRRRRIPFEPLNTVANELSYLRIASRLAMRSNPPCTHPRNTETPPETTDQQRKDTNPLQVVASHDPRKDQAAHHRHPSRGCELPEPHNQAAYNLIHLRSNSDQMDKHRPYKPIESAEHQTRRRIKAEINPYGYIQHRSLCKLCNSSSYISLQTHNSNCRNFA